MGNTKQDTSTQSSQQYTPTAQEIEMNKMWMEQFKQYEPGQTKMYKSAFGLGTKLLESFGEPGSEGWESLVGGISPEQQQRMIAEQQRYLDPQFQQQGLMDSGLAYTGKLRAATDLAGQFAQFNVGARQNALNLALSGQAQIQQPALGQAGQLSSALQGLRSYSGTQQQTQTSNPFLNSFYGALGGSLGNLSWNKAGGFSLGGR